MSQQASGQARLRTRWSAIGAAVAITLGGGGLGLAQAAVGSGDKPITVTVDSERVLDTRVNLGLAGGFAPETPRDVQITGSVDVARPNATTEKKTVVPAGATAVLVNVTVVTPTDFGFLTLRAAGATGAPTTSTVNFAAGSVEPNAATVDLSADGKIQVWVKMPTATATADVLIDIVGYTVDHNHDDVYYTQDQIDAGTVELQDVFNAAIATKADSPTGTSTVLFDPAAFRPTSDTDAGFFHEVQGFLRGGNTTVQGQCVAAEVRLPDGATVTQVDANVGQSATNSMDLLLLKNPLGPTGTFEMAGTTTLMTAGNAVLSDTTVLQPVIDNGGFTYLLALCRYNTDSALRLYDVTVTFQHP